MCTAEHYARRIINYIYTHIDCIPKVGQQAHLVLVSPIFELVHQPGLLIMPHFVYVADRDFYGVEVPPLYLPSCGHGQTLFQTKFVIEKTIPINIEMEQSENIRGITLLKLNRSRIDLITHSAMAFVNVYYNDDDTAAHQE